MTRIDLNGRLAKMLNTDKTSSGGKRGRSRCGHRGWRSGFKNWDTSGRGLTQSGGHWGLSSGHWNHSWSSGKWSKKFYVIFNRFFLTTIIFRHFINHCVKTITYGLNTQGFDTDPTILTSDRLQGIIDSKVKVWG